MKNTALITGASSGIGLELARIHAQKGGDLVLVARSTEQLQQLASELERKHKVRARVFGMDLTDREAPRQLFDALKKDGVQVDILINNAGFGDFGPFHERDRGKTLAMIDLNVRALTELTHMFLPGMVARGRGRVMNLASTASFVPGPLMAVYYATKHFVLAFSEGIARELKGTQVTVTALCPGPTASGFQSASDLEESKLVKGKKLPTSAEVAEAGYRAMEKGKVVFVHGFGNRMQALLARFTPRSVLRNLVYKLSEKAG